jgi:hypothetical protein
MSASKSLHDTALRLPRSQRATLARELIASLDSGDVHEDVDSAWLEEVARRERQLVAGKANLEDWHAVRERISRRLRARRA